MGGLVPDVTRGGTLYDELTAGRDGATGLGPSGTR